VLSAEMERALAALSEDQRAALVLRHSEGYSFSEIREVLGVSSSDNVLSQVIRRGRLRVREEYSRRSNEAVSDGRQLDGRFSE
jgi:DNA-directed RNA polymerase specialized sigma24 family protein